MTRKKCLYMFSTEVTITGLTTESFLFPNIFDSRLVDFVYAEPSDTEGQQYMWIIIEGNWGISFANN